MFKDCSTNEASGQQINQLFGKTVRVTYSDLMWLQGYAAKTVFEALQAPACHENMVKVGGYILGEFGNLIAGDPRSSPSVQFMLLHSKFHLCSVPTRQLLLSTYVKFINLFPETKGQIQVRACASSVLCRTAGSWQTNSLFWPILCTSLYFSTPFISSRSSYLFAF